jgi:dolichol-phosphate mannosyltransferase
MKYRESFSRGERISESRGMIVGVVVPAYKVTSHIGAVLAQIGPEVARIFVVDDCCPEGSGRYVEESSQDPRVEVIFQTRNQGVGGATIAGYKAALRWGCDIVVKVDGDGQMDPRLISGLIAPIQRGAADYCKGNRFYDIERLQAMPPVRLFGNSVLSFINKATSGYWDLMDPTNGFTAIHRVALSRLPLDKLEHRYFFESDMLFRLNTIGAVVLDWPMKACYGDEESSLSIRRVLFSFPQKYCVRVVKRVLYKYFLRGFSMCTVHLVMGLMLFSFGLGFGLTMWAYYGSMGHAAPTGTIMLAVLPFILGFQLLLSAVNFDVMDIPRTPLQAIFDRGAEELLDAGSVGQPILEPFPSRVANANG